MTETEASDFLTIHLREVIEWHFSPETGSPFWVEWARKTGWDPREEIKTIEDVRSSRISRTNGCGTKRMSAGCRRLTTAAVQRVRNRRHDRPSETADRLGRLQTRLRAVPHQLEDEFFPRCANWLMLGPTGPRRLRLSIEHLAAYRGGSTVFRRPRSTLGEEADQARADRRGRTLPEARHRPGGRDAQTQEHTVSFHDTRLLESPCRAHSIPGVGIKGVFCGGTSMPPQTVRFLVEEVCEDKTRLVPTYGNTLMGLAASLPWQLPKDVIP